jgi:hypothetical protein
MRASITSSSWIGRRETRSVRARAYLSCTVLRRNGDAASCLVAAVWGGYCPVITVEYDESTGHLLFITIRYNRRMAKRCSVDSAALRTL